MKNVKDDLIFNAIDKILLTPSGNIRIHNRLHLGINWSEVVIFRNIKTPVSSRVDGSNVRRIYSLLEF